MSESSVPLNPDLRAIQLYQQLLRFHQNDTDKTALADADLHRITWAAKATNTVGSPRHIDALNAFVERNQPNPLAAAACVVIAGLVEKNDPDMARKAVIRGSKFEATESIAAICAETRRRIESPSLQGITTENTWNTLTPDISITYRNHDKICFRAVPMDWAKKLNGKQDEIDALYAEKPVKTWQVDLPATPDYRYRTENLPAPSDLKPGYYCILASFDEKFSTGSKSENRIGVRCAKETWCLLQGERPCRARCSQPPVSRARQTEVDPPRGKEKQADKARRGG